MKNVTFILILLLVASIRIAPASSTDAGDELLQAMARYLSCLPLDLVDLDRQEISIVNEELCLAAIYTATGMRPLWISVEGPGKEATVLKRFLEKADNEGLRPADYDVAEIQALWPTRDPDRLAELDTKLTLNLIRYAHDVGHGRTAPYKTDPKLFAEAGDVHFKPVLIVEQALTAPDLAGYLAGLPPLHEQYRQLRQALHEYREKAAAGGWTVVPPGSTLSPGERDERMPLVRQRLAEEGLPVPETGNADLYDNALAPSVESFQEKFGLVVDGIIGPKTLAALNTTPAEIIDRIIINMARWRWQEHDPGRRYIMVNIANFDLKAVEDGREVLNMAVIVGKFQHQTPVFSHRVQYVDINPFWNIPPSIARNEELPELRKDPMYLVNRNVRLFSSWQTDAVELDSTAIDWHAVTRREMSRYKLRQDPGPWNALGPVKLVFPNRYNVYIHGTPAQELFKHTVRSFSHGCIRASRPLELVRFALAEEKENWTMEKIRAAIDSGERKVVIVTAPLPVHITYQTVWVDNDGAIHFNNDIYGRDKRLAAILLDRNRIRDGSNMNPDKSE
jgi:murein L,D-transpeptidase YcbB/YkuD